MKNGNNNEIQEVTVTLIELTADKSTGIRKEYKLSDFSDTIPLPKDLIMLFDDDSKKLVQYEIIARYFLPDIPNEIGLVIAKFGAFDNKSITQTVVIKGNEVILDTKQNT